MFPSHICILDETGNILRVNRAWRDFADANPPLRTNVCEGANYLAVCDAARNEPTAYAVATALRSLIAGRISEFSIDYPCHSPVEERWFTARLCRYSSDGVVQIAIAHVPITARKLAERALQQSEAHCHRMLEQALDGLYVLDDEGRLAMINHATCLMTGYSRDELIGMHALQVLAPEDHARFGEIWQKLMAGGIDQAEWCLLRKDGSRTDIEVRARMHSNGYVVGFARDITERKEAEQLRHARDAAEAASRAKDQFLAMLSHELRTPLAPVLMATRMIEQDMTLPEHVRDLASTIHRNIEVQAHLIDDLLDQTRIARGKLELHRKKVSIHAVLEQVLRILENEFTAKQLQVRVELHAANSQLEADEARLHQILWNLLKNAIKFTSHHGTITVRTGTPAPNRVRVEVSDTGIGIEPELLPRLFHPFEQGGTAVTRQFGGLGLGLAISQKIAELHGGTLSGHSEGKNRGSTFILEMPTVESPASEAVPQASPPQVRPAVHGLRILLVEDHADTARILARLLKRHGHHVHISNNLQDAEKSAESEAFDLVLSDLALPDGTGYELMAFLRAHHPLPGIAMSGFGMEQDIQKSHEAGFAEHLVKPVDPARLEEAIEHVVHSER
ncbi:PAS domain-containing hybrid sensor histidine kinase/response regulator [Verrucomicrobiota bacterium sgz303538]